MHVLIAPDKFKGCLTAADVAAALAAGVRDVDPAATVDLCPVADGGDGTAEVLRVALGGRRVPWTVVGPLPERAVDASYVELADGTAVVEAAAASGLALLHPADRDPLATTTFGTGQLLARAVAAGHRRVLLCLGGTATVDAGVGCLQACGFTILTVDGEPTSPTEPLCGRDLANVLGVKRGRGEVTAGVEVVGLCDTTAVLADAARLFGPQEGATPEAVRWLDGQLRRLSRSHPEAAATPGSGAAGGLGFAVAAHFGGTLRGGFDAVADAVGLDGRVRAADLCLTGEGRLDATTAGGKTVAGVGRRCAAAGVVCVAVAGEVEAGVPLPAGVTAARGLGAATVEASLSDAPRLLRRAAADVVRLWAGSHRGG